MKTKFLFYSLAVAAAMASCTQEAIEAPVNNVQQDLSVRPTLGEVVLTDDADLMSRFAIGTYKAQFADGDKLGAAIMDKPLYPATPYNENYPADNYEVVEYYSSNAAFTRESGAWKLTDDQPLVEGNYLFYAPYKQSALRSTFEVRTPQRQDASTDKAALEEYYASGALVKVGHQFLASENGQAQKPRVNLYDVMSYPMFTVVNNFDGYTVQTFKNDKGEVIAKDSLVEYTGAIKVDSIQFAYADKKEANKGEGFIIGGLFANKDGVEANLTERNKSSNRTKGSWYNSPLEAYTAELLNPQATIKTDSIITTLVAGGREIAKGDTATFYAVLPAAKFGEGQLQANVYVTIGEKPYVISTANVEVKSIENADKSKTTWANVVNDKIEEVVPGHTYTTTSKTITLIQGQRYPQEELNYEDGVLSTKVIAGRALRLVLAGGKAEAEKTKALQVAKEVPVGTVDEEETTSTDLIDNNEELIQFFKDMESAADLKESTGSDKDYKIDYDKAEFAFSKNTTATINAELIKALSKHTYDGSITINKALVIANDVMVTGVNANTVTFTTSDWTISYPITLGATEYDVTTTSGVVISKDKSVHVRSGATWDVPATFTTGNVRNDGTMNVGTKLTVTTLVNNGILNANASCNIINKFMNNGTIEVNDCGAILTSEGYGKIQVSSSVTDSNSFKYVVDAGGNQTGIYVQESTLPTAATGLTALQTAVVNAEKIAWVDQMTYNEVVDFKANDLVSKVVDITTLNIAGATFKDVKEFDMKNIVLNFGSRKVTIEGTALSQSIVKNVTIKSARGGRVELNNIAASGTFTGAGELYADGVNATWNGEAIGVIAFEEVNATTYKVNTLNGLKEFRDKVNGSNGQTKNNFAGCTITLTTDIDMANGDWAPIGVDNVNGFRGTFDGNGKTISNLSVKNKSVHAGLFGSVRGTVKNLKIDGAYVSGNHFVAALAGQALYGANIENCEVNNATVICTWKDADDSGDKAGVIAGMLGSSSGTQDGFIKNCKASNSTVSASRDAGQIVGAAMESSVTGCTVENVEVSANGTGKDVATGTDLDKIGTNVNDEQVGRKF